MAELIAKATVIGSDGPVSQRVDDDPFATAYGSNILEPPLPIGQLMAVLRKSNILPQCIEAYATNVDGFGHSLAPTAFAAKYQAENGQLPSEALEEKARIEQFFRLANPEMSFTDLRRATRTDLEATGNAYWEILRDARGELAGIVHIPAGPVRLCRLDPEYNDFEYPVLGVDGEYEMMPYRKRFRRFVQIVGSKKVYWKEFWDPRQIDARTGKAARDGEAVVLANEMIHWKVYSTGSPYGLPRWAGVLLSVVGSRAAEEINYQYFDNKSVPPLVVLVSGGHLAEGVRERIETYVEEQIKGRKNFHKMLVIETESGPEGLSSFSSAGGSPQAKVDLKPLTNLIQKDALFMSYDEANREKIRSAFRLPPLYVGSAKDFNRATAEEARKTTEAQVFGPERQSVDFVINHKLLADMRVRWWEFRSLAAPAENADQMTEVIDKLGRYMTSREVREVIERVLSIDLEEPKPEEQERWDWLDQPLAVYLAKLGAGSSETTGWPEEAEEADAGGRPAEVHDSAEKFAKWLIGVRKWVEKNAGDAGPGHET